MGRPERRRFAEAVDILVFEGVEERLDGASGIVEIDRLVGPRAATAAVAILAPSEIVEFIAPAPAGDHPSPGGRAFVGLGRRRELLVPVFPAE